MKKDAIKKYAVWAHSELLQRVKQKAALYGIPGPISTNKCGEISHSPAISAAHLKQYHSLIKKIEQTGYDQVMEETAYTWFNRICALRFMEVNGYLPSHVRVFTDENNNFKPQILSEAINLGDKFDDIDMNRVFNLIETADAKEELYQYLLITQCNALKNLLPGMFTKLEDFAELLCPEHLLSQGSVIDRLITDIPESSFCVEHEEGQIEIIGWLYQYYISEKHEEVVDPLYGKFVNKEDIPAATQLFTTDWVVQYIVDNTVGRYWIERFPNSQLASELKYYVHQTERHHLNITVAPQEITVFDPCVGSGHFLVYAIDVLIKIYREYGYSDRDAISEIIEHNIFGLDIDERAVELAYFAVMMKGCQYDRRFLKRGIQPRIYSIIDSSFVDESFIHHFCESDKSLRSDVENLVEAMKNAQETGSLIQLPSMNCDKLEQRITELEHDKFLPIHEHVKKFHNILNIARILSTTYAAVITNPPYLNKFDADLKSFLHKHYKDYSGDLFSVFIYRCIHYCQTDGFTGLMTPNVWMFIKSYEKLRRYILNEHSITTLVQMAKGAFYSEATVDVCAFVIQNHVKDKEGIFFRLENFPGDMNYQREKLLEAIMHPESNYRYQVSSALFRKLPGMPIGYWAESHILQAFQTGKALERNASPRQGLATTDNNKYLRHWYELRYSDIGFGLDRKTATASKTKWFPYNKGGEFRKWYGNQDYVVNYQHNGNDIKASVLTKYPYLKKPDFVVKNPDTYFSPSLSWSKISSGNVAFRYFPQGFLYDVSGCSIFFKNEHDLYYHAGFLNSSVCAKFLEIISPTLNYETGHIGVLPIIESDKYKTRIEELVKENIELSLDDWNTRETSWGFKKHPLI